MATVLVDSNVLLDILIPDPDWEAWWSSAHAAAAEGLLLAINPIVYAEVSVGFDRIEELERALPDELRRRYRTAFPGLRLITPTDEQV